MSKIARVFHLNKEIQKIYKNGVLQKLFFDWKHYIGNELNIEYAKGYCSHRININGKVYQNLVSNLDELIGNVYTLKNTAKVISNLLRVSTTYTFIVSISEANYSDTNFGAIIVVNYPTLSPSYINISRKNGIFKIKYTVKEEIPKSIAISPHANNDLTSSFKLENLILLEGDLSSENITEDDIKYLEEGTFKPENYVIAGKTYKNLFSATLNQGHVNNSSTSQNIRVNSDGFTLDSTTYTIYVPSEYKVLVYLNYVNSSSVYIAWDNKVVWTNSTKTNNIRIMIRRADDGELTVDEVIEKIVLLKGDYTNIDLPNSINAIESVGEREFVKSKNLYNKKFMNSAIRAQGQFVDSRGFIFTINDECTFKINGTNTTGCTIMSENILDLLEDGKSYILSTNLLHFMAIITYKDDTPPKYTSAFTVNKSIMDTIRLYNQWLDTEIVTYDNFVVKNQIEEGTTATEYEPFYEYFPVTIRNYNYKCGTDNTILPNGVKNSIDTIDGKKVHVQRVWKRVFDGSDDEKWRNGYGNGDGKNNRFEMEINSNGSYSNTYMNLNIVASVCSHFEYEITNAIPKSFGHYRISFNNSLGKIFLLFNPSTNIVPLEDISAWKAWLSENPVTVWYELATPIYTYPESGLYDEITIPSSNIKNEIYSENGKWYHKRNIGKVIFDGSSDENWYYEATFKRFNSPDINDCIYKNGRTPVYIKGYTYSDKSGVNFDTLAFLSGAYNGCKLYIYNYAYTSVKNFRAYLAENPLEVYYELAEPVISELYFSDITYKLNEPLRSLPNGVCDTIEENKLVQRVGKVVLDGNEDWIFQSCNAEGNGILNIFFIIQDLKIKEKQFIICDKYIQQNTTIANTTNEGVFVNEEKRLYLRLFTSKATTVEEAKEYIKNNPFVVYYELETPIETEITPDKIPPFLLKEGLTTLKSTNNITPQIELSCLVRDKFQNMCPNTWVNGDIAIATGDELSSSTSRIKLQDYIAVQPNTTYYCDTFSETVYSATGKIGVRYYKNDKTYISGGGIGVAKTSYNKFTTPEDCYYIKFIVETLDTNYKMYLRPVK